MLMMRNAILAGTLSPVSGIVMGLVIGLAFMASSVFQGKVCATGIQAKRSNHQYSVNASLLSVSSIVRSVRIRLRDHAALGEFNRIGRLGRIDRQDTHL